MVIGDRASGEHSLPDKISDICHFFNSNIIVKSVRPSQRNRMAIGAKLVRHVRLQKPKAKDKNTEIMHSQASWLRAGMKGDWGKPLKRTEAG